MCSFKADCASKQDCICTVLAKCTRSNHQDQEYVKMIPYGAIRSLVFTKDGNSTKEASNKSEDVDLKKNKMDQKIDSKMKVISIKRL